MSRADFRFASSNLRPVRALHVRMFPARDSLATFVTFGAFGTFAAFATSSIKKETCMHLTKTEARRFLLDYQGLWPPDAFRGKPGILDYIRRVGCIQFDPLNIVGHNSELVLQERVEGVRPAMLKELLYDERKLLDGWDKMMSTYDVEDWPYFRRWREVGPA